MSDAWLPRFACPDCRVRGLGRERPCAAPCAAASSNAATASAGFSRRHGAQVCGTLRRAVPARARSATAIAPDGPDYYRMLPSVPQTIRAAADWRIRRESYAHLQRHVLPAVWQGPIRVLDLGAGSGWLSHRLASLGHHVVAVDRLDDERDGLGACRHYPVAFAAVQADFDALPFAAGQFDLVVFNASLHYAEQPDRDARRGRRVCSPRRRARGDGFADVCRRRGRTGDGRRREPAPARRVRRRGRRYARASAF